MEKKEMEQFIDCGVLNSWKLAYHPEGKHLATGTHGGQIHIWNTETGELASTLDTHGEFVTTVQYVSKSQCIKIALWSFLYALPSAAVA